MQIVFSLVSLRLKPFSMQYIVISLPITGRIEHNALSDLCMCVCDPSITLAISETSDLCFHKPFKCVAIVMPATGFFPWYVSYIGFMINFQHFCVFSQLGYESEYRTLSGLFSFRLFHTHHLFQGFMIRAQAETSAIKIWSLFLDKMYGSSFFSNTAVQIDLRSPVMQE